MPARKKRRATRKTYSPRAAATRKRSTRYGARRTYAGTRKTVRKSAARQSQRGQTVRLVITQAPAAPTVNPLTAPLMSKTTSTPRKAQF